MLMVYAQCSVLRKITAEKKKKIAGMKIASGICSVDQHASDRINSSTVHEWRANERNENTDNLCDISFDCWTSAVGVVEANRS